MKLFNTLLLLAIGLVLYVSTMSSQTPNNRISLVIRDKGGAGDTLVFGYDKDATPCLDRKLNEQELPPFPPSFLFDVRFVSQKNDPDCFGLGGKSDIRPFPGPSKTDTFIVHFQTGDAGFPLRFSWPEQLRRQFASCVLRDLVTGKIVNVDMLKQSTYDLLNKQLNTLAIIVRPGGRKK
jgi:hypothetical protein